MLTVWPSSVDPIRCNRIVPILGSSIGRLPLNDTCCERYPARRACRSQPMYLRSGSTLAPPNEGADVPELPGEVIMVALTVFRLPNSLASWIILFRAPSSMPKYPFASEYPSPCGVPLHTDSITTGSGGAVPSSSVTRPVTKIGCTIDVGCCCWFCVGFVLVVPVVRPVVVGFV